MEHAASAMPACVVKKIILTICIALTFPTAQGRDLKILPDPELTPGIVTPLDTKAVCSMKWDKDKRFVTAAMKHQVFTSYGLIGNLDRSCKGKRHFEVDHLVSRELGGADEIRNLWPQCYSGHWNAVLKDRVENRLHKEVCAGTITLEQAQDEIRSDYRVPYRRYFGEPK